MAEALKNVPIKLRNDSNFDSGRIGRWTKTLFAVIYKSRAFLVLSSCISSQILSVKISKKGTPYAHFTLWCGLILKIMMYPKKNLNKYAPDIPMV